MSQKHDAMSQVRLLPKTRERVDEVMKQIPEAYRPSLTKFVNGALMDGLNSVEANWKAAKFIAGRKRK